MALKCGIVGLPNVGKSTLFNALLNQQRAIVADQAGTTRDSIEATLYKKGNFSACNVILEELIESGKEDVEVLTLHAKALLRENAVGKAVLAYQRALILDPNFFDEELDSQLRLKNSPEPEDPDDEDAGRFLSGVRRRGDWPDHDRIAVFGPPFHGRPSLLGTAHAAGGELIPGRLLSPLDIQHIQSSEETSA